MKHPIGLKERGQYTWRQMKKYKVSYGFIAPFMIIFVLFTVAPVIIAMFFSLTNFNVLQPARFVGLENYKNLFIKDPLFLIALKNTILFAAITGPLSYLLCLCADACQRLYGLAIDFQRRRQRLSERLAD